MILMAEDKFKHQMIREIHEEPRVILDTVVHCRETFQKYEDFRPHSFKMAYITGSGTSYHAGLAGGYSLSSLAGISTSMVQASEFSMWIPRSAKNFLLIAFSQSGESMDIIKAAKGAVEKGGEILAVTNTPDSTLARMARIAFITKAGDELAVTATKTYVAQLSAIYQLSIDLAESLNQISGTEAEEKREQLKSASDLVNTIFQSQEKKIIDIADKYKENSFVFLLGSGSNYATALEGALKLKESCNIFAEGYAAREFLHGPMQLVNEKTPMFFLLPPNKNQTSEWVKLMKRFRRFSAPVISVSYDNKEVTEDATDSIIIPQGLPQIFTPILYVVPLQLFSYYTSVARGYDPDAPEKLSKVVKK
jgi:glucosamine--fructose-6-phosphate aminotransferase (isomerizing)